MVPRSRCSVARTVRPPSLDRKAAVVQLLRTVVLSGAYVGGLAPLGIADISCPYQKPHAARIAHDMTRESDLVIVLLELRVNIQMTPDHVEGDPNTRLFRSTSPGLPKLKSQDYTACSRSVPKLLVDCVPSTHIRSVAATTIAPYLCSLATL